MKYLLQKLQESYPDSNSLRAFFIEAFLISVFIFLFLYLFQPFGISEVPDRRLEFCLGFGAITLGICMAYELFLVYVLKIDKEMPSWTLGKWLIHVLILISLIAIGNHLYLMWIFTGRGFELKPLFFSFLSTFGLALFPLVFGGLYTQLRHLRKNLQKAEGMSLPEEVDKEQISQPIELPSFNKKQQFQTDVSQLMYLEAMQNYVVVYYEKEGGVEREIIRNTLSQLEKHLPSTHFFRCHRSFIVNLNQIQSFEGNAQGLRLFLHASEQLMVPVSRKKITELKSILSQKAAIRP